MTRREARELERRLETEKSLASSSAAPAARTAPVVPPVPAAPRTIRQVAKTSVTPRITAAVAERSAPAPAAAPVAREVEPASHPFVPHLGLEENSTAGARSRRRPVAGRRPAAAPVVASAPARPRTRAKVAASLLTMGFVAAIAVATSLPATSLMTTEQIASAQTLAPASIRSTDSQVFASDEGVTESPVVRDGYGVTTRKTQTDIASIGRTSTAFTNNPNGAVQWPFAVGVPVGDRFGYRNCAGCSVNHGGTDFNPGNGSPIQVIADGVVRTVVDGEGSLGVHVIVDHEINGQLISSVYAHMQHGTAAVKEGDPVKVGQLVGLVGSTGMSTGPHLHFEIRLDGVTKVDSFVWLQENTD